MENQELKTYKAQNYKTGQVIAVSYGGGLGRAETMLPAR